MFKVNEDKSIYVTRGDYCEIPVAAVINGEVSKFKSGDVLRFKATKKKDCNTVVIQRDYLVDTETDAITFHLTGDDTRIGAVISKPTDYWYEVELNPDTDPQTIIGYDEDGAKVLKLFPEGADVNAEDIEVVGKQTLQDLVDTALANAKASGKFDGEDGKPGADGKDGQIGKDGTSPVITVSDITGGHRITITDATGTQIVDVMDGKDGESGSCGADWVAKKEYSAGLTVWENSGLSFTGKEVALSKNGGQFDVDLGLTYDVYWNGVLYTCDAKSFDGQGYVGNGALVFGSDVANTGEPFCFEGSFLDADRIVSLHKDTKTTEIVNVKITTQGFYTHDKMPEEYLPECVVKHVNGKEPDANGNVEIEVPSGSGVDVTASVGQTIVVEEVDANGKPTKWKAADYQERTHGTDWLEIVPLTEFTPIYDDMVGAPAAVLNAFDLVAGEEYKVVFDGAEYICEAISGVLGSFAFIAIGNNAFAGGEDTGEPFGIVNVNGVEEGSVLTFDMNHHSVQVFSKSVTPIPVQYMSNALPYYIEVTGSGTDDDPYVCNDTESNLYAVYASGREMKIRLLQTIPQDSSGPVTYGNDYHLTMYWEQDGLRKYTFGVPIADTMHNYITIATQDGQVVVIKGATD